MKILVTGSSGLIGSRLMKLLGAKGHEPIAMIRDPESEDPRAIYWNPEKGEIDSARLEGFGAVVHLSGENIADKRWTTEQKRKIRTSRIDSTKLLAKTLAQLQNPPQVFITASAIGYYGDRGSEELREKSPVGIGFLANLCREWEDAAQSAQAAGIRVVKMRFGMVLSPDGGPLAKMLKPFRMGFGGPLGTGQQYMSWISIDDACDAVHYAIIIDTLKGPVNVVAPSPVTNAEFTKVLSKVIGKPANFAAPAFILKLIMKGLADEILLSSAKVVPDKLLNAGFEFKTPKLEPTLRRLLGETSAKS